MLRRFSSVVIAVALAVCLCPAAALADGGQLRAGDAPGALSVQKVKPKDSKLVSRSLVALYKPVLKKAVKGKGKFASAYSSGSYGNQPTGWDVSYCVYDIDANGIPELLVSAGRSLGDTRWYVFTVLTKGKVKFAGTVAGGHYGLSASSTKKGFLCSSAMQAGTSVVNRIRMKSNKVSEGEVAKDGPYADFLGAPKTTAYENKHQLKALTVSSATDYALLKKKAKISSKKIVAARVSVQKSAAFLGKKITPKITVKYLGSKLKKGRDYKVVYKNAKGKKVSAPKAVGTYKVIVKGKGSFKGKVTKTFKIEGRSNVNAELADLDLMSDDDVETKTVTKYDVTGDGKADKLKIVAASYSASHAPVKVYVNGKLALTAAGDNGYCFNAKVKYLRLSDGKPYLFVRATTNNQMGSHAVYQYVNGKFVEQVSSSFIPEKYSYVPSWRNIKDVTASGTKLKVTFHVGLNSTGYTELTYRYAPKGQSLKRTSSITKNVVFRGYPYMESVSSSKVKVTAHKSFVTYAGPKSSSPSFTVKRGDKVTITAVYMTKSRLRFKVKSASGLTGWFDGDSKYLESDDYRFVEVIPV